MRSSGDNTPAATLNHAYYVIEAGTVFGVAATEGQVLVGDGSGFYNYMLKSRKELEYNISMENKGFVPSPLEANYINALSWINSVEVYSDSGNQYRLTLFEVVGGAINLRFRNVADEEISKIITLLPLSSRVVLNLKWGCDNF